MGTEEHPGVLDSSQGPDAECESPSNEVTGATLDA